MLQELLKMKETCRKIQKLQNKILLDFPEQIYSGKIGSQLFL